MSLQGRVALVTGGSQGIGKAIVARLAREGARVAFCGRTVEDLQAAAAELSRDGAELLPLPADVSDHAEVERLVARVLERFGRIDILVNNAAVLGPIGPAWENDPVAWQATLAVNVVGAFLLCRAVVPTMISSGGGKIINLSGGGSADPFPRYSAYAASKAALVRFTETLAVELAEHNIQVNAIGPGMVATRLHQQTLAAGDQAGADYLRRTRETLDRGGVDAAVPAALVAFLASKQADWITGKLIHAVWDDWAGFDRHVAEITKSDLYTLRRIVPADRGLDWK